eukprot:352149-Chlamydomonas_euryale.AAC.14
MELSMRVENPIDSFRVGMLSLACVTLRSPCSSRVTSRVTELLVGREGPPACSFQGTWGVPHGTPACTKGT